MAKFTFSKRSKTSKKFVKGLRNMPSKQTLKSVVKEVVQKSAEQKIEYNWNAATMTTTGTVSNLMNIGQGDTFNDRQGNLVKARYVEISFNVLHSSLDSAADGVMVALVYDKQPNGTLPVFSDIFDTANAQQSDLAFKNYQVYGDRFHICWVKRLPMSTEGSIQVNTGQAYSKVCQFYKVPDSRSEVRYSGAAAGNPISGGYYFCHVAGSVVTNAPTINWTARVAYTDI